jgi:hypothetical protein
MIIIYKNSIYYYIIMTDDNKKIIKRSYSKKEKYEEEQKNIVRKLNEILGLNEKNNKFILEELKQDEEKQKQIIGLEEDVKKYFAYSNWGYFRNENITNDTKTISLTRAIYKNSGYDISYRLKMKNKISHTEYLITKKNI